MNLTDELIAYLRSGTAPSAVFKEIPLGAQSKGHTQRADVLAIKKSYNLRITIYEVKQSRSDFMRDMNKGKYEGYLPFCHQLYFVTPQGLIIKDEVPENTGLMVRTSSGFAYTKGAQTHSLGIDKDKLQELLLVCLWRDIEYKQEVRRLQDRIAIEENIPLADRAKRIGWEIRRRLAGDRTYLEYVKMTKEYVDNLLGYETATIEEALRRVNDLVRELGGANRVHFYSQLLNIVSQGLSPWGDTNHYLDQIQILISKERPR